MGISNIKFILSNTCFLQGVTLVTLLIDVILSVVSTVKAGA